MPTVNRAADHATSRFQSVPFKLKTGPRKRNASGFLGASELMNWGKNARKNRATFGLSTFVRKPWMNTVCKAVGVNATSGVAGGEKREERINEMPTYTRYAAPMIFNTVNAVAEAASMAESPSAAAAMWTTNPAPMPRAAGAPARQPCVVL